MLSLPLTMNPPEKSVAPHIVNAALIAIATVAPRGPNRNPAQISTGNAR